MVMLRRYGFAPTVWTWRICNGGEAAKAFFVSTEHENQGERWQMRENKVVIKSKLTNMGLIRQLESIWLVKLNLLILAYCCCNCSLNLRPGEKRKATCR